MLNGLPLVHFLCVSAFLFVVGLYVVLVQNHAIRILMGIEIMIQAAVLNLVAFAYFDKTHHQGQLFVIFALVLAAAGVAVVLAIISQVHSHFKTIDPDKIADMHG